MIERLKRPIVTVGVTWMNCRPLWFFEHHNTLKLFFQTNRFNDTFNKIEINDVSWNNYMLVLTGKVRIFRFEILHFSIQFFLISVRLVIKNLVYVKYLYQNIIFFRYQKIYQEKYCKENHVKIFKKFCLRFLNSEKKFFF